MRDNLIALLGLIAIVGFIALVIWLAFFAPCGFYQFTRVADVPLRCL